MGGGGLLGVAGSEGPGWQPLYKQGKSSDSTPHTHTYLYLTPTHSLHKQRRPAKAQAERDGCPGPGSRGLWPGAASGRGGEGGQDRVALRAILRLRTRMTEQADILAAGNKSPDSTPGSRCPVAGVPKPPGLSSASAALHPSAAPLERSWWGDTALGGPIFYPASPTLLFSLSCVQEFHPPQLVPEQVLHQSASGGGEPGKGASGASTPSMQSGC